MRKIPLDHEMAAIEGVILYTQNSAEELLPFPAAWLKVPVFEEVHALDFLTPSRTAPLFASLQYEVCVNIVFRGSTTRVEFDNLLADRNGHSPLHGG